MKWFRAALLLTAGVSTLLLLLPLSSEKTGAGTTHRSLLVTEGPGVMTLLTAPVLVSAIPLLVPVRFRRYAAWGSVALLSVGVVVSLLSIGVFYLSSVVLLSIGALRARFVRHDRGS